MPPALHQNGFQQTRSWTVKHQAPTPRSIVTNQHSNNAIRQSQETQYYELSPENPIKTDSPPKHFPLFIILYNMLMSGLIITQVCRRHIQQTWIHKSEEQGLDRSHGSHQPQLPRADQISLPWQLSLSHSPAKSSWEMKNLMESSQSHSI